MSQPVHPEEQNPYKAPRSESAPDLKENLFFSFKEDTPETLRDTYATQEASVKAIGLYLYLSAVASLLGIALAFSSPRFTQQVAARAGRAMRPDFVKSLMIIRGLSSGLLHSLLGYFLRSLQNWARWIIIVLTVLGILGQIQAVFVLMSPSGIESAISITYLLIHIYIPYILLSSNSKFVCSSRYRSVVAETSQFQAGPNVRDLIFLGTAAVAFLVSVIYLLF